MRAPGSRTALASVLLALLPGCGDRAAAPPADPPALQFAALSADPVVRGERLGRVLGCRGCHGDDLTGRSMIDDPDVAILFTSNLTRTVLEYDDAQLARAIRSGVRADGSPLWGMPSEIFTDLGDPDMAALIAWMRTLAPAGEAHPRIAIGPEGRRLIASGVVQPAPIMARDNRAKAPPRLDGRHDWARYMIRATCGECHGLELTGHEGTEDRPGPPDLIVAGAYTREQFRHLLRTGEAIGGRQLGLMADVARGRFAFLTDREADAIYDYLIVRAQRPQ